MLPLYGCFATSAVCVGSNTQHTGHVAADEAQHDLEQKGQWPTYFP